MMYNQSTARNTKNMHREASLVAILSNIYTGHATPSYTLNIH